MSSVLTTFDRMQRMYEHKEADRVPVCDSPWLSTLERWRKEGMPEETDYADYFGLDKVELIFVDNSPRYPVRVIEDTDDYNVSTTNWGAKIRNWKHAGGVPEFLDHTIKTPALWSYARPRIEPSLDRIDWKKLQCNYRKWRDDGVWISAFGFFGFDATHSWVVGTERTLMAMAEDAGWIVDIFDHTLKVSLALLDQIWDAGYRFDELFWTDDMGYKNTPFFSPGMYRELLKPIHKKAVDWAHQKGLRVRLHSCGDIRCLIPDLIDIGIEMLNPLEVKAGMDPVVLKNKYGDKLGFHGGLNALLYNDIEKMWSEMRNVIPAMKANGGYVVGSDHSVPDSVSLEEFREFVRLAKELGSYD